MKNWTYFPYEFNYWAVSIENIPKWEKKQNKIRLIKAANPESAMMPMINTLETDRKVLN